MTTSLLVGRDDLHRTALADEAPADLTDGQARLRVASFALTANNITYGAFGAAMRYWDFFPAAEGWGRIPVWGFADVEASRCEGVAEGDRVYGYFPMSTHLVVEPTHVSASGFTDGAAHRQPLPPVYNRYERVPTGADPHDEALQSLLRPLFMTSFVLDDWLADHAMFGAGVVVLGSASSKTALGLAHLLTARERARVVGLTSEANVAFVAATGDYHTAVAYGSLATVVEVAPVAFVDMAGSAAVRAEVHHHFGDELKVSCMVGATHWDEVGGGGPLPGPSPTLFFAPDQITKRRADWGPGGFEERFAAAWDGFTASTARWLEVVRVHGPDAVAAVYQQVLDGHVPPSQGIICSL